MTKDQIDFERLSIRIDWSERGVGFGQLGISIEESGEITLANEFMTKEFVKKVLYAAVDKIIDEGTFLDVHN